MTKSLKSGKRKQSKTTRLSNKRTRQTSTGRLQPFGDPIVFGDGAGSPKSLFRLYNSQKVLRKYDINVEERPTLGERLGQERYEPVILYVKEQYVNANYVRPRP